MPPLPSVSVVPVSVNAAVVPNAPPPRVIGVAARFCVAFCSSSVPAETTIELAAPSPPVLAIVRLPALTVIAPVFVFKPPSTSVPAPFFVSPTVVVSTPEKVLVPEALLTVSTGVPVAAVIVVPAAPFKSTSVGETLFSESVPPVIVTFAVAAGPSAVALPTVTVPRLIVVEPVKVFAAERVSVPVPFFTMPPEPPPSTPVSVMLPVPPKVSVLAPFVTAPSVSCVVPTAGLFTVKMLAPVFAVTAPKVTPAVAEVTFAPAAMVSVFAPIDSVPSVCVTPAPAVFRSVVICASPVRIVGRPKFSAVSLPSCNSPPASVSVPAPSACVLVVARKIPPPAFSVMPPVNVLAPLSTSVPAPLLIKLKVPPPTPFCSEAESVELPAVLFTVSVAFATFVSSTVPLPLMSGTVIEVPFKRSVPPPIVTAFGVVEFSAPALFSTSTPALTVTPPVKVLLPESVHALVPLLIKAPVVVPITPVTVLPVLVPPSVKFNPAPVTEASERLAVVGLKIVAPEIVTAPKASAGAPPTTFAPWVTVSVFAPMPSVPSVCVTPGPDASTSEVIVTSAETVVLFPKTTPALPASWSTVPAVFNVSPPTPSALAFVAARSVPPVSVTPPVNVFAPVSTSVPAPVFVSAKLLPPSPIAPPTVSAPALTVTCRLAPKVTAPVPRSRSFGPTKVKSPFQFCRLFVESTMAAALVLPRMPPLIVSVPVPSADALFRLSRPAVSVVPPAWRLTPERFTAPAPVLLIASPPRPLSAPEMLMSPVEFAPSVSRFPPFAIAPATVSPVAAPFVHDCAPPSTSERFALPSEVACEPAFIAMPLPPIVSVVGPPVASKE